MCVTSLAASHSLTLEPLRHFEAVRRAIGRCAVLGVLEEHAKAEASGCLFGQLVDQLGPPLRVVCCAVLAAAHPSCV